MSGKLESPGGPISSDDRKPPLDLSQYVLIAFTWPRAIMLAAAVIVAAGGLYYGLDDRIDEIAERLATFEGMLRGIFKLPPPPFDAN